MKVLLISANTEKINMPTLPLGLASVAAATRGAGHEVAVLNLMFERDTRVVVREADSLRLNTLKITMGIRVYPHTSVAKISMDEGLISPHDDLLLPRFYLTRGLEDWLSETLKNWVAARPHWMFQV